MICDTCEAFGDGVAIIMAMAITVAVEHVLDCSEKRYGGWIGGGVPVLIKKGKELKTGKKMLRGHLNSRKKLLKSQIHFGEKSCSG